MDDTPLMRELTRDHARRRQLEEVEFTSPEHTRIVTIANQKGGVGKTSTTVNLAAALTMGGLHVLVIDADPQGNTSTALSIDHHAEVPSMYEVLVESTPLAEVIQAVPEMDRLYCAPATINLSGAEIELVSLVARENRLRNAIRDLLEDREQRGLEPLDYVLIDCPPSLGLLTVNALTAAHGVIIPLETEFFALRGVALLVETIEKVQDRLNPGLEIDGILATMFDGRTLHAKEVIARVVEAFGDRVFDTVISRTVKFPDASVAAEPIISFAPTHTGAQAYRQLACELVARGGAP